MVLDDETRQHIENVLESRFAEGRRKYHAKRDSIKNHFWMPTTDKRTALSDAHDERADEMRQLFMDTMLAVYQDHGEFPGENSIAELANRLSYHLTREMEASVRPLQSNLVTDTQSVVKE